jgi:uncharacterized RDD family membrane protein YckC
MEIGLRVAALLIDIIIGFVPFVLVLNGMSWVVGKLGPVSFGLSSYLMLAVLIAWPPLYLSIPTALWGRTPGKLICRLSVTDYRGKPPGFPRALGREVLKCLSVGSMIGAILTLLQLVYQGGGWYDQLCGTRVEYNPYVRLTETQKKWREYHKNK